MRFNLVPTPEENDSLWGDSDIYIDNDYIIFRAFRDSYSDIEMKILGLMVLFFVVFSSSSCNNIDLELNEELDNIVKEDYFQQYGFELENYRFYGLYNEAAVFFIPDATRWIKTVTI